MPSPKRWHPVSRDLNHDGEVWAFTQQFGDRALRTWIEILAIIDRCENHWRLAPGWLESLSCSVRQQKSKLNAQVEFLISSGWLSVLERDKNGSPSVLGSTNYWKYHKRRESNGVAKGANVGSSLPNQNIHDHSYSEGSVVNAVDMVERGNERRGISKGFESTGKILEEWKSRSFS